MPPLQLPPYDLQPGEDLQLAAEVEVGVLAAEALNAAAECESEAPDTEFGEGSHDDLEVLVRRGKAAWRRLYESNLRLVQLLAARAAERSGVDADDLLQEGFRALGVAMQRFDHTRGVRFSTMAWSHVGGELNRYVMVEMGGGSLEMARSSKRVRDLQEHLATARQREVQAAEVAALVGRSTSWVRYRLETGCRLETSTPTRESVSADPVADAVLSDPGSGPPWWLAMLDERSTKVLELRYGLSGQAPLSVDETAHRMNCSPGQVRRIEARAKAAVRAELNGEPPAAA